MIITDNNHRFFYDVYDIIKIENNLIFNEIPFNRAKDDNDLLVVSKTNYLKIIDKIKEELTHATI